ncbi:LmbE family N-acetylglucosaminyl deacetylase [Microbacterium terrae]|uniref:Magnesium-protoporphyrin O-methyltransferase n=1 Tax=Microbacterium terrae TaxID=69369 RepID=A0A0M2H2X0_9MICO|nr:PIG-L family deacetylase [Microbacterium terrae]KJL38628.1 Magnesium-protoporphyrin O-methyltransferase [Microbacterium terrae]MBP1076046.1 LmbE family N-acetylglucosaminyl deacetylase [Microbacterium terrae]GLJ96866.1 hypothetical protein GCM10017594_00630 [Microbacterium terrae]
MTAAFSHLDPGTPEAVWRADTRLASLPALDIDVDDLIVVSAHPDDETLGAGGLMHQVSRREGRVTVVIATDGEASYPDSSTYSPTALAGRRRIELITALLAVAPRARVHFLALPDGRLDASAADLEVALAAIIDASPGRPERALIAAPWSGDGHRDHRIAAESVSRVAGPRGIRHVGYPIWLWHWGLPEDVPWRLGYGLDLSDEDREAKERALRAHVSQVARLSDAPGDEPIISSGMASHFARDRELFLTESRGDAASVDAAWFDDFYARHDDPWGFESRWYEKRKRALLLASLPSPSLGSVLEIGCATGLITTELAERARHVLALDASSIALDAARARIGDDQSVDLRLGVVPGDWPHGEFDTIVLSEVGYYFSLSDLDRTVSLIDSALAAGGTLVACHWRHPVADYPLTGDQVHARLRTVDAWHRLSSHEEEDFVLEVFTRDTASVARREGLA